MRDVISKGLNEFCNQFANWGSKKTVCITFDIDFAPDYMIQNIVELLNKFDIKATFFATHQSEFINSIINQDQFEFGIHPNLSSNSTQGKGFNEIVKNLKSFYPGAVGNRFHQLKYSYGDLDKLGKMGFMYDVSAIRFNCPYLLPVFHKDINMTLLTYSWEDGLCENAYLPMTLENIDLDSPGIKILNFHPMNVFINSPNRDYRINFLVENPDLLTCPEKIAQSYINTGDGAGTVFVSLLNYLGEKKYETLKLRELHNSYINFTK